MIGRRFGFACATVAMNRHVNTSAVERKQCMGARYHIVLYSLCDWCSRRVNGDMPSPSLRGLLPDGKAKPETAASLRTLLDPNGAPVSLYESSDGRKAEAKAWDIRLPTNEW